MTSTNDATLTTSETGEGEAEIQNAPNIMVMKMIVIFLGVILAAAMITFFILLFTVGIKEDEPVQTEVPNMRVHLASGERVEEIVPNGRDMAIRIVGPEGQRIVIVNPYTKDHKAVINLKPDGAGDAPASE